MKRKISHFVISVYAGPDDKLYAKATSAVRINGSIGVGGGFRTTVGVRQWCLLSPTLLQHFSRTDHAWCPGRTWWNVSIGGRNITNLRFADDIDAVAEEQQELEALVESLDKTCTRYKMEISAEKTKLMANSANGIQREIKVKGQKLGTVTSFKYLGAVVSNDGSKPEVLSRKTLQLLQSWSPFGEITTYLLDQRWSWCAPLSFPYFCMPVNHWPWLQS